VELAQVAKSSAGCQLMEMKLKDLHLKKIAKAF
jgi:hypothetical protein